MKLNLTLLRGKFAIAQLPPDAAIPAWISQSSFFSISRSAEELSIICEADIVPDNIKQELDWRALRVQGPIAFEQVGVLANLSTTLADGAISIFSVSTFDTDYMLVKQPDIPAALKLLEAKGHTIEIEGE